MKPSTNYVFYQIATLVAFSIMLYADHATRIEAWVVLLLALTSMNLQTLTLIALRNRE